MPNHAVDYAGYFHASASACVIVLSGFMAVYFGRFSCFYEMRHFDAYAADSCAAIFAITAIAFAVVLALYAVPGTRYSSPLRYFALLLQGVFGLCTPIFGISVFAILMIAANSGGSGEVAAAEKLLTPDRVGKEIEWERSTADPDGGICELQHNLGCMMWTRDDCVLPPVTAAPGTTVTVTATTVPKTTANSSSGSADGKPVCVTCGLAGLYNFTAAAENSTAFARPPTCFKAMLNCFAHGQVRGAETGYSNDNRLLISGSLVLFFLAAFSIWKNATRSLRQYVGYGVSEYAGAGNGGAVESDYNQLRGY